MIDVDLTERVTFARTEFWRATRRGDRPALRRWSRAHTVLVAHKLGARSCCRPDGPCGELGRAVRLTDGAPGVRG